MTTSGSDHQSLSPLLTDRPDKRRWLWFWLLAVCLVAAGVAIWYYAPMEAGPAQPARPGRFGPNAPGRATPVLTALAKTDDINIYLGGLGSVTPLQTVTVKSRVDGQLMRVLFREGQMVKEGEVLAEIDPRPYQAQLNQVEGQLARDMALLKNAQIDFERYRTLYQQDSIAKQILDTQEALVRQYEGTVKADQGSIDNARLQLAYCRITAPVGGRLGLRQIDAGNMVRAGDAGGLVVITQLQPISVIFSIPEDNVPRVMKKLQAGEKMAVDVYDRADKNKLASGILLTVDNQIDATTGTVKLKAQFSNTDYALFPNQFVNVRLLVDKQSKATLIPTSAVQRGTQGTFAYVIKSDNTATVRPIKLGAPQGDNVAIESGVEPGERVVIDGADRLREGAKVELPDPSATPGRRGGARKGGAGKDGTGKGDANKDGGERPGAAKGAPAETGAGAAGNPGPRAPDGGGNAGGPGNTGGDARPQLLTPQERDAVRERMQNAASPEERAKIRDETRALVEKRAREKGITLPPPGERGGQGFGGGGGGSGGGGGGFGARKGGDGSRNASNTAN